LEKPLVMMGVLFPVLIMFVVLGVVMSLAVRVNKEKQSGWLRFYTTGKDSGFSFKEIELLRRLALKSELDDPASLFWSQNQLDRCIRAMVQNSRLTGTEWDEEIQAFLSKLYDYRKKIELEKPKAKQGLSSSTQLGESQPIRILLPGTGVFKSWVIKNTAAYLTVARPSSVHLPQGSPWAGRRVSVYFWREADAGYVFDTDVLDDVFSRGHAALKIAHVNSLFRTQKRKSIRVKTHISAYLYLMGEGEEPGKIELNPGLKCVIEDLSDSGCAVTIGGKAKQGIRVKLQFLLDGVPVVMSGTVRSAEYREDSNRSLLHIEAAPLDMATRNTILGEVFRTSREDEDTLPFRITGETDEAPDGGERIIQHSQEDL
jgi:c-di-GMP-binding flagellar brake protein YcgR